MLVSDWIRSKTVAQHLAQLSIDDSVVVISTCKDGIFGRCYKQAFGYKYKETGKG